MPPKEMQIIGKLYCNGKEIMNVTDLTTAIEASVKPIGDLHSVPHYRCGYCHKAIVIYENDEKPERCKWCGVPIDWNEYEKIPKEKIED